MKLSRLSLLPVVAALLMAAGTTALTACREEKKEIVTGKTNPETDPTMLTRDVETLISDSGIMRYRIVAPLWMVFDNAARPRWTFPQGLSLEKFDDFFRQQATVVCDSAIYFSQDRLWRLDGNVNVANVAGERFVTNQLYWDERARRVYSDSFIHIEKSDRTIEGYGFVSNERLTQYSIRRVSGMFPVEDLKARATDADTIGAPGIAPTTAPPVTPSQAHGAKPLEPSQQP